MDIKKDYFLEKLNRDIEYYKDLIKSKLTWVKDTTNNIEMELKKESVNFDSLGEYQSRAQSVDLVIVELMRLIRIKEDYIGIKVWEKTKEVKDK